MHFEIVLVTFSHSILHDSMTLINLRSLIVVFFFTLVACKSHEDVEFRGIQIRGVTGSEGSIVTVKADAILFNPNEVKGKVRSIDVAVLYKGVEVAEVNQLSKTKVPGNAEFSVPLVLKVDMDKLNTDFLSQLTNILSKKGIDLQFVGNVKVSRHGGLDKGPGEQRERRTF